MPKGLAPFALAGLAALACSRPSATISLPEASTSPAGPSGSALPVGTWPSTDVPACQASIDDRGRVLIGGARTDVQVDADRPPRVRVFPWDDTSVLVAIGMHTPAHYEVPEQLGTLHRVTCDRPREWIKLVELEGADFAWAELSLDRRWLYFSWPGVGVLDFAAWDWAPLSAPRMISRCWSQPEPVAANDFVFGRVDDSAILVYSGGPCGFESEWEGKTEVVDGIREDEPSFRRERAFVGTVSAGSDGRVWVGDGGQCVTPEAVNTRSEPGVWRSSDSGESWEFLTIAKAERGIAAIWTRPDQPGTILAHAECCYESAADFCNGGELFLSEDGGASWKEVSPRLGLADPDAFGPPDELVVDPVRWRITARVHGPAGEQGLVSLDGGRTWQSLADGGPSASSPVSREAIAGEFRFEPGLEGLIRTRLAEPVTSPQVVLRP